MSNESFTTHDYDEEDDFYQQEEHNKQKEHEFKVDSRGFEDFEEIDYQKIDSVTDWYICQENLNNSFIFPGRLLVSENRVLRKYLDYLNGKLHEALNEKIKEVQNDDFREIYLKIQMPMIDGLFIFRGNKIKTVDGEYWALRRVKGSVPDLRDLKMSSSLIQVLTNENLRSGLVLIVGETGNGKSTTCAAIVKELCSRRGAFALTVEDPPELPLHGNLGKGVCLQTEVRKGGFAEAIRSAMRSYPAVNNSILYVGEIRDLETAKELIKISANGHLVFTTIHGDSIITGLKRLVSNANESAEEAQDIRIMLASSLRLVIHQVLETVPSSIALGKEPEKVLKAKFLLLNGFKNGAGNAIYMNKIDSLNNIIERQERMLETRGIRELIESDFKMD